MNNSRITYVRVPTSLYSMDGLTTLQVNVLALVVGFGQNGLQVSSEKLADIFGVTPRAIDQAVKIMSEKGYVQDLVKQNGKRRNLVATPEIFSVVKDEKPLKNIQCTPEQSSAPPLNKRQCTPEQSSVSTKQKEINKQKKTNKMFSLTSDEVRLSQLLLDLILERKPDYKRPGVQLWAGDIDKLIRLDNRTPERIEAVIRWSQSDSFWADNILSTEKLRKQFDQLELKMLKGKNGRITTIQRRFEAAPNALAI
jgi:DNA-binding MarR family transcriptional regulator